MLFAGVCLLDELGAGLAATGSASFRDELSASYSTVTLAVLVAPMALSLVLEPLLLLFADRYPRRWAMFFAMLGVAGALVLCGVAWSAWVLGAALGLYGLAGEVACGIAQAGLVDGDPEHREKRMAQWTLAGAIGDLGTPVLLATMAHTPLGWRAGFFIVAVVYVCSAFRFLKVEIPRIEVDDDEPSEPLTFRLVFTNRALWVWSLAVGLCGLLDETLVAFAVLFVRDALSGGIDQESAMIGALTAGSLLSSMALPKLLDRHAPRPLLLWSAALCALVYGGWLVSGTFSISLALFFLVGVFVGPLYPLAKAQAYRALPERSGVVNAFESLFTPIDIAAPILLAWIADHYGVRWALACLILQPIGLFLITLSAKKLPKG